MNLNTIYTLNYGDDGQVIEVDDKLKVSLTNGEILIGEYQYSDFTSLTINRDFGDIDIDFDTVENIEILEPMRTNK